MSLNGKQTNAARMKTMLAKQAPKLGFGASPPSTYLTSRIPNLTIHPNAHHQPTRLISNNAMASMALPAILHFGEEE